MISNLKRALILTAVISSGLMAGCVSKAELQTKNNFISPISEETIKERFKSMITKMNQAGDYAISRDSIATSCYLGTLSREKLQVESAK